MSVVLAIKHKDRFVIGADKQASTGGTKAHTATKVWEAVDLPGVIIGSVGSVRAAQIIQYSSIIDKNYINKNLDTEFIVRSVVPTVVKTLEANGVNCEAPDEQVSSEKKTRVMPNAFIIAYDDKAWVIWNDLSVIEVDEYFAIGSGSDIAKGVLYATKHKDPFERIVEAIDAAAEESLYVDSGIDILATKYYAKDKALLYKALGIEEKKEEKAILKDLEKQSEELSNKDLLEKK